MKDSNNMEQRSGRQQLQRQHALVLLCRLSLAREDVCREAEEAVEGRVVEW
jgi:hypothetical protein